LSEAWAAVGEHGAFALDCVELWWIDVPFVRPVSTAVGVHRNRPLVLVQLRGSADGRSVDGWGECAALADTTYDDEDVAGSFFALEHRLVPALVEQATRSHGRLPRPSALDGIRRAAPGGTLAFAALEMAVADAHLRSESRSFAQVLRVEDRQVEIGAVVGTCGDTGTLVDAVAALAAQGFTRVKMKIGPGWDVEPVGAVAAAIPGLRVQADANGSYSESDSAHLGRLDRFGLLCLEQPFAWRAASPPPSASTRASTHPSGPLPPSRWERVRWCASSRRASVAWVRHCGWSRTAGMPASRCGSAACTSRATPVVSTPPWRQCPASPGPGT
jgi:hypothetical protein